MKKQTLVAGLTAVALAAGVGAVQAKVITVALQTDFTTLDPYDAIDVLSKNAVKAVYEGLFTFDKDLKVVPALASSIEPSADGLTYTVHLRPGVKFSDGEPFNAQAVKVNIDRVLDPKQALSARGLFKKVKSVEVVDDLTVRFHLVEPFSAFPNYLATPSVAMMCPKLVADTTNKKEVAAYQTCGTGPYMQVRYNPSQYFEVKKNPNYRVAGLPKLDGILFRPTPEAATTTAMLSTGEADFAVQVSPEQVAALKGADKVEVKTVDSIVERQAYINTARKPFSDVRVRQALNYAVNKEALIKVVFRGYAVPATGVAPKQVEFSKQFGVWPYDPKKAKELLKEAGYPNGFETTLWSATTNSTDQRIMQFLQQQLAQVGVKATVQALESGARATLVQSVKGPENSKMNMVIWGFTSQTGEMDWVLRGQLYSQSWPPVYANFGFYKNENVDKWIDGAVATTDAKVKADMYAKAQEQIWHDAPWIFLYVAKNIYAQNKHLKGFYVLPNNGIEFSQAQWVE